MEWPWPHYILQELGFAVGIVISLAYQPTVFTIILLLSKNVVHRAPTVRNFFHIQLGYQKSRGLTDLWNLIFLEAVYNKSIWTSLNSLLLADRSFKEN